MYTSIVVPLDCSPVAERALMPAAELARRLHTRMELVMVSSPGLDVRGDEEYLREVAAKVDDPKPTWRILPSNVVATTLLEEVASDPSALLCMATHGRGNLAHAVLGSTAEEVLRGSASPVVLVGPAVTPPWTFDLVMACIEPGSDASHAALAPALAMAMALDGALWLVEVRSLAAARGGEEAAETDLEAIAHGLREGGIGVEWQVQDDDKADAGILRAASSLHAGLLAMTTRARSGLVRATVGSVTMSVVRRATCPVLVIPPTARD